MGFNFNPQKYLEKNINFKGTFILLCYNFGINKKKERKMTTLNKEYRKALNNLFKAKKGVMDICTLKRAFELLCESKNAERAAYGRCGLTICYYKLREARRRVK